MLYLIILYHTKDCCEEYDCLSVSLDWEHKLISSGIDNLVSRNMFITPASFKLSRNYCIVTSV